MQELSSVFLDHEDWPEWFTLDLIQGLDPTVLPLPLPVPLLILGIAEEPLKRLVVDLQKYSMVDDCKKRLKEYEVEADFLLNINKPWGFAGVLNPYHRQGRTGIREYAIPIPQVEKDAGVCTTCDGEGYEWDLQWDCLNCNKTGRRTVHDWDAVDCISATLCVLGTILCMPDKKLVARTEAARKQLLTVQTHFERGRALIGATLSGPFSDYLRSLSGQELPEVKAAMRSVYLQMFPRYARFGDSSFKADVHRNGQLIIDVPGNACGLGVDGFSNNRTSGPLKLHDHNVDGHHQQLTLLCGLAAVSGMARKSLYPDACMA